MWTETLTKLDWVWWQCTLSAPYIFIAFKQDTKIKWKHLQLLHELPSEGISLQYSQSHISFAPTLSYYMCSMYVRYYMLCLLGVVPIFAPKIVTRLASDVHMGINQLTEWELLSMMVQTVFTTVSSDLGRHRTSIKISKIVPLWTKCTNKYTIF